MFHRLGYVCDERRATIMDKKLIASLAVLFVTNINPAHAQNAGDMVNLFTSMMRGAMIDRSRMEWSKLPLKETSCIERQLEAQGYSIGTLIQSEILPSDARVSEIRAGCRPSFPPSAELMSPDIAFVQEASIEMFHRLGYVCDERSATIMDKKLIASLAVLFVTNINPAHAQNAGDMVNLSLA